jgi:hypothetical protein
MMKVNAKEKKYHLHQSKKNIIYKNSENENRPSKSSININSNYNSNGLIEASKENLSKSLRRRSIEASPIVRRKVSDDLDNFNREGRTIK